ncbi:hypothetical protein TNCV_277601 [Trichonephila clavipes]|uniref:Uncharacterized protein n=1 Tax=Trichonephila clavipes TaxID=2585209 RepID=A0A8X6S9C3_TRICX|nr:hypothetical protein TNCV_277601 [Trichonephila clavipes]
MLDRTEDLDTFSCVGKNPIDTVYEVGSVIEVLIVADSLYLAASLFQMVSLDTTGCLEGDRWRRTESIDVVREDMTTLMIERSSSVFVFLGRLDPSRW